MNNRDFPWLVLVPRRDGLRELFDLKHQDYSPVMEEVRQAAKQLAALTSAHKINVAALGNILPQLHIHIIARRLDDKAWPNAVWNAGVKTEPYPADEIAKLVNNIKESIESNITKM